MIATLAWSIMGIIGVGAFLYGLYLKQKLTHK